MRHAGGVCGEAVVAIAIVGVRPGDVHADARREPRRAAQLDAAMARGSGVAIVEPRGGDLIRNELAADIRLKERDAVGDALAERAARANFDIHGPLRPEAGIDAAGTGARVRK